MTDIDRYLRLAETASNDIAQAISMDLEIALDHSRYANWLIGYSTGGIAFVIYKVHELMPDSLLARVEGLTNFLFLLVLGILAVSVFAGAWAKRNVLRAASLKRQQIVWINAQKSYLLSKNDSMRIYTRCGKKLKLEPIYQKGLS